MKLNVRSLESRMESNQNSMKFNSGKFENRKEWSICSIENDETENFSKFNLAQQNFKASFINSIKYSTQII